MKCKKCGAEYGEDVKFCTQCGAPMGDEGQDSQAGTEPAMDAQADGEAEAGTISAEAQAPTEPSPAEPAVKAEEPKADGPMSVPVPASGEPEPNKKFLKILFAVIAVLAVIAIAAVAYVKMNAKDPKQVVIDAFEKVYTEGQVFP